MSCCPLTWMSSTSPAWRRQVGAGEVTVDSGLGRCIRLWGARMGSLGRGFYFWGRVLG